MQVAGEPILDRPEKLTQVQLSEASGVARSTLSLHAELDADKERSPNPKLEQICRIADALNVPPALLLMREEDWVRLAQAINYFSDLRRSGRHPSMFSKIATGLSDSPLDQAQEGHRLARSLDIDGRINDAVLVEASPTLRREMQEAANSTMRRIFSTASLPPVARMKPDERLAAFVIGVIWGAHTRPEVANSEEN